VRLGLASVAERGKVLRLFIANPVLLGGCYQLWAIFFIFLPFSARIETGRKSFWVEKLEAGAPEHGLILLV
jgi:hypothetical protein